MISMNRQARVEEAFYPIGAVSEQTGIHAVTLRAWERRYGLLKPCRTPKGHRLYSQQDIDLVHQILQLLDRGIPVGRVRDLMTNGVVVDTQQIKLDSSAVLLTTENPWPYYIDFCRRCIYKLDARSLDKTISEAVVRHSLEKVASHLFLPLCLDLSGQCSLLASTCAEYAFWYEFLCAKLASYWLQYNMSASGKRLILMGSSTERLVHLQMLLFASILSRHGFQTSLLGANCEPQHLPLVLERSTIDAVIFCTPNADVLTRLDVLSRVTKTHLLVHYLDIPELKLPSEAVLPIGVNPLPHSMLASLPVLEALLLGA